MLTSINVSPGHGHVRAASTRRQAYSPLYRLGLTYLGISILFEFLDQLMFLRLLGFNAITHLMLLARLAVDMIFIGFGLYYGISAWAFRGLVVNALTILTAYGLLLGLIGANDISDTLKDLVLFGSFILKFAIFKAIFLSGDDIGRFFAKLEKYCWFTLYAAVGSFAILFLLKRLGFSFYEQGISNVEWFVAYSAATNRPIGAIFGLAMAFLLAKRMVLLSSAVIFFPWIAKRLFSGNPKIFISVSALAILAMAMMQFVTIDPETLRYAVRIEFEEVFREFQNITMDEVRNILIIIDAPRYLESWSALQELEQLGFWIGGGFGFNYVDVYTTEIVGNAHFSPIGFITKIGFVGMLVFYYLVLTGAISGIRARHPMAVLCGYYVLSTIAGSLFTWKFFLSSPLLPMALAATLYCRSTQARRAEKQS